MVGHAHAGIATRMIRYRFAMSGIPAGRPESALGTYDRPRSPRPGPAQNIGPRPAVRAFSVRSQAAPHGRETL
jgi:hypothetical protein